MVMADVLKPTFENLLLWCLPKDRIIYEILRFTTWYGTFNATCSLLL